MNLVRPADIAFQLGVGSEVEEGIERKQQGTFRECSEAVRPMNRDTILDSNWKNCNALDSGCIRERLRVFHYFVMQWTRKNNSVLQE